MQSMPYRMRDPLDILLADDPSPEDVRRLQERMAADSELRERVLAWARAIDRHQGQWEDYLPDRSLLVLQVLKEADPAALTEADLERLRANEHHLSELAAVVPSEIDVRQRVEADCWLFNALWTASEGRARRLDRSALPQARRGRANRWMWRVPVGLAVVLFVAVAVLLVQRDAGMETVATGPDEYRTIEFADGSTVRLMENSRLRYVPDDRRSIVNQRAELEGRALFDIAGGRQGFIVETPVAMATVLGTLFGVDATSDETAVTLVEGRLALASQTRKDAAVVLDAGQQSRVVGSAMPTRPVQVDLQEALAWSRMFIFRGTALPEIARQLTSFYGVRVVVDDAFRDDQITGTFDQGDPLLTILQPIAATINARIEERQDAVHLLPQ